MSIRNILGTTFHTVLDFLNIGEKAIIPWVTSQFRGKELLDIGAKLTYYYFAIFLVLFWWKIPALFLAPLSNVGDFLAGVFGPVAFCWLIIGYLMQNKELSMNRKELQISREALEKQAEELSNSVKQQKEIVRLMNVEMASTRNAEMPVLDFNSLEYNLKGDVISGITSSYTIKSNRLTINLQNTGKEITNTNFILSFPEEYRAYISNKTILKQDSWREYSIEVNIELDKQFKLYFDFLTFSQNHYRYEYEGRILMVDGKRVVRLFRTDDHDF